MYPLSTTFAVLFAVVSLCILLAASQSTPARTRLNLTPKLKNSSNQEKQNSRANVTAISNVQERSVSTSSSSLQNATNNNSGSLMPSGRLEFIEDELPADFYEMPPEQLDLGMNATGRAPVPILNVAVLQNGQMIDSAINVHPGTPLEMVIFLDDKSAKVYGLLASYLKVQDDTFRQREEVIILNGCSIDTYIFGNFELNPEDQSLRAKFRAFKFPDSNFVRFVGTVNVCIKQCAKVNCGGNRKKRASHTGKDDRLVLTVSTVLRISNPVSELQRVR